MIDRALNSQGSSTSAAWLRRTAIFAALWWILDEGRLSGWWFAPAIIAGALAIAALIPQAPCAWRWRPAGLARFVPYFLRESIRGGWDVARIALRPDMPLDPRLIEYRPRLQHPTARLFFTHVISLLPGTLSADLRRDVIVVHSISGSEEELLDATAGLERRVADLFGEPLAGGDAR
ncbi:MAG: Na+/H+ antiporter subunit E [Kiritimatiellae bacterium]|nr:Na+/H+ antiporter subunit E [Kiritimatiellia bacterium]MDW8457779.1 Na+/H+ antiporter subunit E [Verrucomicrobiota bacterium]